MRTPQPGILIINQFFWPDGAPTGLLAEDVARELVKRGCEVTVVCGRAAYLKAAAESRPPVRIISVPALPYVRTTLGRALSWLSFLFLATFRSLFVPRVDLVVTMTSPPGLSIVGAILKTLRRCRFWIWEMDLYPDVATATGAIRRDSKLARMALGFLTALRRRADGIIVLGACMKARLLSHGLDPQRIVVAENWADGRRIQPATPPELPPLRILYAGNLGLAHEIETIGQVMLRLKENDGVRFAFAGSGARREELQSFCKAHAIDAAQFSSFVDRNLFSESLGRCHIGLVTLRPECVGTVVPSKMYSFLAAGRPFLFIGPPDATPAKIAAEGCGWQRDPGDVDGIVQLLEQLVANPERIREAARHAHRVFRERYDVPEGTGRIVELLLPPNVG